MYINRAKKHILPLAAFAVVAALALGKPSSASAEAAVKIDFGIADIMRELRALWNDILARSDFIKEKETRESAHGIVLEYLRMAGLMDTFSDELEKLYIEIGNRPSCSEDDQCRAASLAKLGSISHDMQSTMQEIYANVRRLDAQWASDNFEVTDSIMRNVDPRGLAVGESIGIVSSIRTDFRSVTQDNANDIIEKLRHLAREARAIALEVSRALNA